MNKNTFEGIQYFIELAKLGSITLVTKSLNVDHKTIKQKVQLLEKTININLVESSHQGTRLTEEGWDFYQKVSSEYTSLNERVEKFVNKIDHKIKSTINLLVPPATGLFFATNILPKLYAKHPEIDVHITTFDLSYIKDYGSHVRGLLNKFNFIFIDEATMYLINQDEWLLAFRQQENQQLYATQEYLDKIGIQEITDLHRAGLITRAGTFEEYGVIKLVDNKNQSSINIQFNHTFSARNDLIKAHLANQSLGVTFISKAILQCGQNLDLIKVFPDYTCEKTYHYAALYKTEDIHKKYIRTIAEITKSVISNFDLA